MKYFDELKRSMEWLAQQPNTIFIGQAVGCPGTAMFATDSGANFAASAFSIAATRNTLGAAPVTATRTPEPESATKTPTMA